MAGKFAASVRDWADRTKAAQNDVLRSSVEDFVALASVTQEGFRTRSGPPRQGAIPVDSGHLRATVAADVNGSGQFSPDATSDVTLVVNGAEAGDVLHVAWTAEYAQRINSGFSGTDAAGRTYEQGGVHFVETAAASWDDIVQANAAFLKP